MKGNLFLGMGRGSVGDVTYSRVGGQQVGRARNRSPKNPRTAAQMYQRSQFGCAVSFFSKGRQAFFTYGFESKKSTESDYNAFIRVNSKNGVHMTKDMLDNIYYPKIGNWQMSQGSLPIFTYSWVNDSRSFIAFMESVQSDVPAEAVTLGEVSQKLIASGNYEYGDIITILEIKSAAFYEEGSDPIPVVWEDGKTNDWVLDQFILDPNSTVPLQSFLRNVEVVKRDVEEDSTVCLQTSALSESVDQIGGFCVVHSRKQNGKLKVSTSVLANSLGAQKALAKCSTQEYIDYVLVDWQSRQEAVLEGSLSTASSAYEYGTVMARSMVSADGAKSYELPHALSTDDYNVTFKLCDSEGEFLTADSVADIRDIYGEGVGNITKNASNIVIQMFGGQTATVAIAADKAITFTPSGGMEVPAFAIVKKK